MVFMLHLAQLPLNNATQNLRSLMKDINASGMDRVGLSQRLLH